VKARNDVAENPPPGRRPAGDRAPSTDGRPIAAALAIFALGRRDLATVLAVIVVLDAIR
jgi:hypothetical protein